MSRSAAACPKAVPLDDSVEGPASVDLPVSGLRIVHADAVSSDAATEKEPTSGGGTRFRPAAIGAPVIPMATYALTDDPRIPLVFAVLAVALQFGLLALADAFLCGGWNLVPQPYRRYRTSAVSSRAKVAAAVRLAGFVAAGVLVGVYGQVGLMGLYGIWWTLVTRFAAASTTGPGGAYIGGTLIDVVLRDVPLPLVSTDAHPSAVSVHRGPPLTPLMAGFLGVTMAAAALLPNSAGGAAAPGKGIPTAEDVAGPVAATPTSSTAPPATVPSRETLASCDGIDIAESAAVPSVLLSAFRRLWDDVTARTAGCPYRGPEVGVHQEVLVWMRGGAAGPAAFVGNTTDPARPAVVWAPHTRALEAVEKRLVAADPRVRNTSGSHQVFDTTAGCELSVELFESDDWLLVGPAATAAILTASRRLGAPLDHLQVLDQRFGRRRYAVVLRGRSGEPRSFVVQETHRGHSASIPRGPAEVRGLTVGEGDCPSRSERMRIAEEPQTLRYTIAQ